MLLRSVCVEYGQCEARWCAMIAPSAWSTVSELAALPPGSKIRYLDPFECATLLALTQAFPRAAGPFGPRARGWLGKPVTPAGNAAGYDRARPRRSRTCIYASAAAAPCPAPRARAPTALCLRGAQACLGRTHTHLRAGFSLRGGGCTLQGFLNTSTLEKAGTIIIGWREVR